MTKDMPCQHVLYQSYLCYSSIIKIRLVFVSIYNSQYHKTPPNLIGSEAFLLNSHHLEMQESINDRFFFLLRSLRRPAVLTFRKIIILPLYDSTFSLGLRNIQVCHMETVLLLHPRLNLLICSPLLEPGHVHVFEREFNFDILTRNVSLGKLNNRLDVCMGEFVSSLYIHAFWKAIATIVE